MAAPVDAARATTDQVAGTGSWVCNMPAGIQAGDLLIAAARLCTIAGGETFLLPAGWNWLVNNNSSDPSDDRMAMIYRWAAGGDTLTWSHSPGAQHGGVIVWRITGAHPSTPPEVSALASGSTGANACDPPNVTPTGGPKDFLYLVWGSEDGEVGAFTAAPSGYSNLAVANSGTAGSAASNCMMGGASKETADSSSEDPGNFTCASANSGWGAFTVAVHPAVILPGRNYRRLYGPAQLGTSAATVYTVPAGVGTRLRRIWVNNPSGAPVGFTMSVGTDAAATRLYDDEPIPAGESLSWAYDHALVAGEFIQANADAAAILVLVVDGVEEAAVT